MKFTSQSPRMMTSMKLWFKDTRTASSSWKVIFSLTWRNTGHGKIQTPTKKSRVCQGYQSIMPVPFDFRTTCQAVGKLVVALICTIPKQVYQTKPWFRMDVANFQRNNKVPGAWMDVQVCKIHRALKCLRRGAVVKSRLVDNKSPYSWRRTQHAFQMCTIWCLQFTLWQAINKYRLLFFQLLYENSALHLVSPNCCSHFLLSIGCEARWPGSNQSAGHKTDKWHWGTVYWVGGIENWIRRFFPAVQFSTSISKTSENTAND